MSTFMVRMFRSCPRGARFADQFGYGDRDGDFSEVSAKRDRSSEKVYDIIY